MPGHRSPNFSRLKDLLPSFPPPKTNEDEVHSPPPGSGEPAHQASSEAVAEPTPVIQGTAAVQQLAPARRSVLAAKPGKAKPLTRPSTFRLAIELQDALKSVADYNRLNMTDIVAEGIWMHLQNFEWPPGSEELRDKLRSLF